MVQNTLRVLNLCGRFLPDIGGVEIHVDKISEILAKRGYLVTVQCTTPEATGLKYPYEVLRVENNRDRFIPREKYDIIHAHDYYVYDARLYDYAPKVYVTYHGWEGRYPPDFNVIRDRKQINNEVSGSICVGKYIEKWYQTPCNFIVWGGIDRNEIPLLQESEPNRFIYVGGLRDDLNINSYLKIVKCFGDRFKDTHLDIVGGGSPTTEEAVKSLIVDLGIDVHMYGWMLNYNQLYAKANYVFAGGYLSMLKALAWGKTTISIWDNELKRDYVEWFPAKLISGELNDMTDKHQQKIIDDFVSRIVSGLPPEIKKGNQDWALKQTWGSVVDKYEELWGM